MDSKVYNEDTRVKLDKKHSKRNMALRLLLSYYRESSVIFRVLFLKKLNGQLNDSFVKQIGCFFAPIHTAIWLQLFFFVELVYHYLRK